MSANEMAVFTGLFVPVLVALLTKLNASKTVKIVTNAGLSAIAGYLSTLMPGQSVSWKDAAITISIAWAISTCSYLGLWKHSGITDQIAEVTPNFGLGKGA